jgi:hypothetical protein
VEGDNGWEKEWWRICDVLASSGVISESASLVSSSLGRGRRQDSRFKIQYLFSFFGTHTDQINEGEAARERERESDGCALQSTGSNDGLLMKVSI